MKKEYEQSINVAKGKLFDFDDKAHDLSHAERVTNNARTIGGKSGYKDIDFLEMCGWWHDVGRTVVDKDHEEVSATLLRDDLLKRGIDEKTADRAYGAVQYHRHSMKPKTLEGRIVRDADKLDFISIDRWTNCLEAEQYFHIKNIVPLLPKLRDLLDLNISKEIYDSRIKEFNAYYETVKNRF